MIENRQLSQNFWLHEFLRSQTAARMGRPLTNPPPQVVDNLERLCVDVLQPARDLIGAPVIITSGWRPEWLNVTIGGSRASQHITGNAADFVVNGLPALEVARRIESSGVPYDQLIYEFGGWVHISQPNVPGLAPRAAPLTAYMEMGRTRYAVGVVDV